jgi:hypothetical protein
MSLGGWLGNIVRTVAPRALVGTGPVGWVIGGGLLAGDAYWNSLNADKAIEYTRAAANAARDAITELETVVQQAQGPAQAALRTAATNYANLYQPLLNDGGIGRSPGDAARFFRDILGRLPNPNDRTDPTGRQLPNLADNVIARMRGVTEAVTRVADYLEKHQFNLWWRLRW